MKSACTQPKTSRAASASFDKSTLHRSTHFPTSGSPEAESTRSTIVTSPAMDLLPSSEQSTEMKSGGESIYHIQKNLDGITIPKDNSDIGGSTDRLTAPTDDAIEDTSDNLTSCVSIHSLSESLTLSYPSRDGTRQDLDTRHTDSQQQRGRDPLSTNARKVSFGTVEARAFIRTAGDHPAVRTGAALDLTWNYRPVSAKSVDEYESERQHTRHSCAADLVVARFEREALLRDYCDVTRRELAACVRSINKSKAQRRQTLNNLKFTKFEEYVEKVQRGASRAVGLRKTTEKEIAMLWRNAAASNPARNIVTAEGQSATNLRVQSSAVTVRNLDDTGIGSRNIAIDESYRSFMDDYPDYASSSLRNEISTSAHRNLEERRRMMPSSSSNTSTSFFVRLLRFGRTEGNQTRTRSSARTSHRIGRRGRMFRDRFRNFSRHLRRHDLNLESSTIARTGSNTSSHAGTSVAGILQGTIEIREQDHDFIHNNSRHHRYYDLTLDLDDDDDDDMSDFCEDFSSGCHVDNSSSSSNAKPKGEEISDPDLDTEVHISNIIADTASIAFEGAHVRDRLPEACEDEADAVSFVSVAAHAKDDGNDHMNDLTNELTNNVNEKIHDPSALVPTKNQDCDDAHIIIGSSRQCPQDETAGLLHQALIRHKSVKSNYITSTETHDRRTTRSAKKHPVSEEDDNDGCIITFTSDEVSALCSSSATAATFASSAGYSLGDDSKFGPPLTLSSIPTVDD